MIEKLSNLDRRWVFLSMALAVAIPILANFRVPESPTEMTRITFNVIDELPPGSTILMAVDYAPSGKSELDPMAAAITRHAAVKGHNIIFMTLWPTGPQFIDRLERILREEFPEYQYGRDFVDLGFKTGNEGVIKVIVNDLRQTFPTDASGNRLAELPLTADMRNIRDVDLIVSISGGTPGSKEWIQYASTPFGITTIAGVTGVQTPLFIAYYPGQLQGLLGSIKAAAEYESILLQEYPELAKVPPARRTAGLPPPASTLNEAQRRMGPQLVAHLLMIGLIIVGNIAYFFSRGSRRR